MTTGLAGVELRTAPQVCAQLGQISDVTLWRRVRNPELGFPKPIKITGRNYFRADEVDAWIEAQPVGVAGNRDSGVMNCMPGADFSAGDGDIGKSPPKRKAAVP